MPHLITATALLPGDRETLAAGARALFSAAAAGPLPRLLEGKNIGLLCATPGSEDAVLFERAASELGARVARIDATLPASLADEHIRRTARTLGRLYDAIECQGLAGVLIERLRAESGVPVYDGIACASHPSAAVAAAVGEPPVAAERRCRVLQALLVSTMA